IARTLNRVKDEIFSIFLARLSRFKFGALPPTDSFIYSFIYSSLYSSINFLLFSFSLCHRPAVQISPSIKRLFSRFKLGALPRTYDLPTALPQLAEHPIKHTHD